MAGLRSDIVVGGLLRNAESLGGNGVVVARGDADAGALLLVLTTRGRHRALLERVSDQEHGFTWNNLEIDESAGSQRVARLIDGKKRFDRDLWIVELDIPDVPQFIADMPAPG